MITRDKSDLRKRLWAPYDSVKSVLNLNDLSEDQKKALEESIVMDLIGEEPKLPVPYRRISKSTTHLNYAIIYLYSSIGRFATYRTMFRHYPWRGKLSKSDHIQSTYYLFVHECYILEERLKGYFRAVESFVKEQNMDIDTKSISKKIMKLQSQAFRSAIRMRGVHVHQDDVLPGDIKRLVLFDLLLLPEQKDKKLRNVLGMLQRFALRDTKKNWMQQCDYAETASQTIVALAFDATMLVWKRLAEINKIK